MVKLFVSYHIMVTKTNNTTKVKEVKLKETRELTLFYFYILVSLLNNQQKYLRPWFQGQAPETNRLYKTRKKRVFEWKRGRRKQESWQPVLSMQKPTICAWKYTQLWAGMNREPEMVLYVFWFNMFFLFPRFSFPSLFLHQYRVGW